MSTIELKIRQFLKGKDRIGPSLSLTLVRLHEWITSIQSEVVAELASRPAKTRSLQTADWIENTAEGLIEGVDGIERQFLSKSLQETLFYCVGFHADVTEFQLISRLKRFLARHDTSHIIQRFLSLYFFNFVWFQIGESFRPLAQTPTSFEEDMENVERVCQRIVLSTWKSSELTQRRLDLSVARELAGKIEDHLRGT